MTRAEFTQHVRDNHDRIRRTILYITKSADKADDAVSWALMRAWEHRDNFVPGTNFGAWVIMIARNKVFSDKRRDWRQQELPEGDELDRMAIDHRLPDGQIDFKRLPEMLTRLSPAAREAVLLIGLGFTYLDAEYITGANIGTIKSRTSRGRETLAQAFD